MVLGVLLLGPAMAAAQTSYPMLMDLSPVAAQIGQTSQHTLRARASMEGASFIDVSGAGVTGKYLPPEMEEGKKPNFEAVQIEFAVAADAQPGIRAFRLATPRGASTLGQLVVTPFTVVNEAKANNTVAEAEPVPVPGCVCGAIEKAEDVDVFQLHVAADQTLAFHVLAMRLEDSIHDLQQHVDPILTLRGPNGGTLAESDNYFYGDPFFTYHFQAEGDYFLEIRDARYQGNQYWRYAIEIGDRPFVLGVHPLGVRRGEATELKPFGVQVAADAKATIHLSAEGPEGIVEQTLDLDGQPSNPVQCFATDLPVALETESENNTPAAAQEMAVDSGLSGRMEQPGDIDCYRFEAKKDERFTFEVFARRLGSSLDGQLRILDEKENQKALIDDGKVGKRSTADPIQENWTAPADGNYVLELRDLHLRGGEAFAYYLQLTRCRPSFRLFADTDKTQLTPGGHGVLYVRAERVGGFEGEIALAASNLPPGVTAHCGKILATGQDGCILLEAASDAAPSLANIHIAGSAELAAADGAPQSLTATAAVYQEVYMPGGGRGHWPATTHAVCVGAPSDIRAVTLSTNEISLKPGESKRVDVKIDRAEGFDKNVTLDVVYGHLNSTYGDSLPKGVTLDGAASNALLTGGATEGHLTLKAADDAPPVEKQQVPVMAHISLNFVMKATYAAKPLFITVEPK
ncbi:MAG: PPC domain-containing protein [Planctomycetales bacterium]|nr:PPC domain-containing protein [Planctomycetales bacterium]